MTCPNCAAAVPDDARFCPSCGFNLVVQSDERRVVTVLFGDLVGFTGLAETRDPEQVKNLVDRCFARLVGDITSFGGRVDKIVGDAIVALFGAPVAHEDDAERAVRAALQMQRTLAEDSAGLSAVVEMRIGVNTGEVLVGALRAGGDYTAMGDVVNTASRLQTSAQPGQVLVGGETHAATREVITYEPLGPLTARGRDEPVDAWVAVAPVGPPGRRRRRTRTPLVGRDAELGMLRHTVDSAIRHRRAGLVLLMGDAGLGKSRLAEEVAAVARGDHDAEVLEGRSVPYGEANPWWPVAEVVRHACGIEPTDSADRVREQCRSAVADITGLSLSSPEAERLTEGLLYLLGDAGSLGDVDASRAREEAMRSARTFLEGKAEREPLLVVLSDLQWADPLVLEFIDGLLQRVRRLPLVVLATARPDLEERWRPVWGHHNLLVLNLDPLDAESVAALVGALMEQKPDDGLRALLQERSGGNPFFLEELVTLLAESGALTAGIDMADTGRQVLALPATLRGVVAARLDALPASERSVVEDAAVLGRRGPVEALVALAESRAGARPLAHLESLVSRDLLELTDGRVGFRSDLVREVAYGTLTKAERARRHAAMAAWLVQQTEEDERDEHLEVLAHHLATAAELTEELGPIEGVPADIVARALDALEYSAERADERETHVLTARLYERALGLLDDRRDPRHRHFLIGRARARVGQSDCAGARCDIEQAIEEADAARDQVGVARALTVLGDVERNEGFYAEAIATLGQSVELWRRLGDRRGEAAALRRWGMASLFAGDFDDAERQVSQALEAFREIGARRGEAWALQNLAWISFVRSQLELADERLRASQELFREIGDWGGLGWATGLLAWVRFSQGRRDEAEVLIENLLREGRDRGDRWATAMMTVLQASLQLWAGRSDEAVELAAEARRLFQDISNAWGEARALAPLVRGLVAVGRVEDAHDAVADSRQLSDATMAGFMPLVVATAIGDPEGAMQALEEMGMTGEKVRPEDVEALVTRGLVLTQLGRIDEAVATLEQAHEMAVDAGTGSYAASSLALAYAAAGRPEDARTVGASYDDAAAATYFDRVVSFVGRGCVAARVGDADTAEQALSQALHVADATGDRLAQALVRLARGRALEALRAPTAAAVLADARRRLGGMGISASGWDTAFRIAVGSLEPVPARMADRP